MTPAQRDEIRAKGAAAAEAAGHPPLTDEQCDVIANALARVNVTPRTRRPAHTHRDRQAA